MADEKFITTVEQRLVAVDETGDAFQKVIEKQEQLNKATEKGTEAVDEMAKKWAESEIKKKLDEAKGAADETTASVGKMAPAAIAASVAVAVITYAIKECYKAWKELSDAIERALFAQAADLLDVDPLIMDASTNLQTSALVLSNYHTLAAIQAEFTNTFQVTTLGFSTLSTNIAGADILLLTSRGISPAEPESPVQSGNRGHVRELQAKSIHFR